MIYEGDGFDGIKALLPPPPRRALVLVDPSYEDKRDYARTLNCIEESLKRFRDRHLCGLVSAGHATRVAALPRQLKKLQHKNWLHVQLTVSNRPTDGFGLFGSGMFI